MTHWFRVHGHELGVSRDPDFVQDDGLVYPTATTRPRDARDRAEPWFAVVDAQVFPTGVHPDGDAGQPWFEVIGSFVYAADGHPGGACSAPWYQVRRPDP